MKKFIRKEPFLIINILFIIFFMFFLSYKVIATTKYCGDKCTKEDTCANNYQNTGGLSSYCGKMGDKFICYCTATNNKCNNWGNWGECKNGYQTRYCNDPNNSYYYQIRTCSSSTNPPSTTGNNGGGNTSTSNNSNSTSTTSSSSSTTSNSTLTPTPTSSSSTNNLDFSTPASSTGGKNDLCENLTLSSNTIGPGETISLTAKAKNNDIKRFIFEFYNIDNRNEKNKPNPIIFGEKNQKNHFKKIIDLNPTQNTTTISLSFDEIDKPDLNWHYYKPKPKNIWIETYMIDVNNKISKYDSNCSKKLISKAIDPTPTINPNCKCSNNKCTNACFFDKIPKINYSSPRECAIIANIYQSSPDANNQTQWCRYYLLSKGDANGDGKVNLLDYFYYQQAQYGGKIPPSIYLDFNGDGLISSADKTILIKSINLIKQ